MCLYGHGSSGVSLHWCMHADDDIYPAPTIASLADDRVGSIVSKYPLITKAYFAALRKGEKRKGTDGKADQG